MRRVKILFVDENTTQLEGLKSFLSDDIDRWDVSYVEDGLTAIEYLQSESYDVVVTDIHMPIIDGHQLLVIIRERFPSIIRIVFSYCEDQKTIMKIAPLVHRFIAKPCSASMLRRTIENTLYLYVDLDNEAIRKVLIKTTSLPSVPIIYTQLMEQIDDPNFSLKEAAELIGTDMGLTVNILKQVNHLGLSQSVTDISQAVALLGLDVIRAIALTTHIFHSTGKISIRHFSLNNLMRESFLCALFAKQIVMIEGGDQEMVDQAFIAGLLHQLGTLVFVTNFPDKYEAVLERVCSADRPILEVEENLIGVSHPKVGAHLLALWGIAEPVLTGVAFYRDPLKLQQSGFTITTAVYSAYHLAGHFLSSEEDQELYQDFDYKNDEYLNIVGLTTQCAQWETECGIIYRGYLHG